MKKIIVLLLICFIGCAGKPAEINEVPEKAVYLDASASVQERTDDLLGRMTLKEKVGQMLQVDRYQIAGLSEVSRYLVGSVLHGGGSNPSPNTPEGWADTYDKVQKEAMKTRLQIPILYGIDAVHGNGRIPGAVVFPHNIGLGAANNPELAERIGYITALETRAAGVHWTFAPCIAVPQDIRWGRTYEGFSEDPAISAALGAATIKGMQGSDLASFDSILACAKHFVGDGGTKNGEDQGDTIASEQELREIHLRPYYDAIAAGTGSVMASFSSWNGEKMHGNKYLLDTVLRKEMGFNGILVSDWAAVNQLPGTRSDQMEKAINAGIDLFMLPGDPAGNLVLITGLVEKGRISEDRIDEAVRRILEMKFKLGLFENRFADHSRLALIGKDEHRETARQAVRESAVLLKNEGILPLRKDGMKILIAGSKADDIGAQCGGWTFDWQGKLGDIEGGTSILSACKAMEGSTELIYSRDGSFSGKFDAAVLVVGERPYAEMKGDRQKPSLSAFERKFADKLLDSGIPTIVIVLSGRPLIMTDMIDKADAVIAAWLPGTEAQGLADILFGDYSPGGKLPFTWPASEDFFKERNNGTILYPLGYGLGY